VTRLAAHHHGSGSWTAPRVGYTGLDEHGLVDTHVDRRERGVATKVNAHVALLAGDQLRVIARVIAALRGAVKSGRWHVRGWSSPVSVDRG